MAVIIVIQSWVADKLMVRCRLNGRTDSLIRILRPVILLLLLLSSVLMTIFPAPKICNLFIGRQSICVRFVHTVQSCSTSSSSNSSSCGDQIVPFWQRLNILAFLQIEYARYSTPFSINYLQTEQNENFSSSCVCVCVYSAAMSIRFFLTLHLCVIYNHNHLRIHCTCINFIQ